MTKLKLHTIDQSTNGKVKYGVITNYADLLQAVK